jgi:hypothetical protein
VSALLALLTTLAGLLARLLLAATLLLSRLTGLRIVLLLLVRLLVRILILLRHVLILGSFLRPTRPACCWGRPFLRRMEGHLAAQLPPMHGVGTYLSNRFKREI